VAAIGLDPRPDHPGPEAGGRTERIELDGERDRRADRVRDAGFPEPSGRLGRPRDRGQRIVPSRRAGQLLGDELPVVFGLAPGHDAAVLDQLEIEAVPAAGPGQAHLVGLPAQRAERAPVDQLDEEPVERDPAVRPAARRLLGHGQLGVQAARRPRREPGQAHAPHGLGQPGRPPRGRQVVIADQPADQRAVQVVGGQPLAAGLLEDLVQPRRVRLAAGGVGGQAGEPGVSRHGRPRGRRRSAPRAARRGRSGRRSARDGRARSRSAARRRRAAPATRPPG
jgi:hypothetical protein